MTNSLVLASLLLAVKSVRQKHQASVELLWLLDEFRRMVNVCIAVGIEENISSLKTLSLKSYHRLSREMLGYYRLGAIGIATVMLHNYRKAKKKNPRTRIPWARKLMLTTCYGFRVKDSLLRLPVKPWRYVYLNLNTQTLKVLSGVDIRSVTLTPHSLSMTYRKDTIEIKPEGYVGVDRNLDNVTVASTDQTVRTFDLSKATRIASDYRYVKSQFKRNDARIRVRVLSKYGENQRNRSTTAPQGVQEHSCRSEDKTVWDCHGDADWDQKTLSQGERAEQKLSGEDEQLELWRAAATGRV